MKTARTVRSMWRRMKLPFLSEKMLNVCEERWAGIGKQNAVLMTRERLFASDSCTHISWKHKWDWHNGGCVWSKNPSEWSGDEEWGTKREDASVKRTRDEDPMRTARTARASWKKDEASLPERKFRRKYVESDGLGLQRRENTALTSLEHAYAWRSTTWWKNAQASNLLVDPTTTHCCAGLRETHS